MTTLNLDPTASPATWSPILAAAQTTLEAGGLVIFPTETVYGALVDATNPVAIEKLLKFKKRRRGKPLSIAINSIEMATKFVDLNDQARQIYQSLLPGPITVISASNDRLPPGIASEFHTIGVRWPAFEPLLALINNFGRPVTATSANRSGAKNPYSIADIFTHLSPAQAQLVDLIIDAGQLPKRPPSVVIDTTQSTPLYLRQNPQSIAAIEKFTSPSPQETQQLAQKILFRHFDQLLKTGLVLTLDGVLGAGKTVFTQGLAEFLQLPTPLPSPTYTYLHEYDWQKDDQSGRLYHLDLWRIDQPAELKLLDLPTLIKPGNLVIIEWWQQVASFLPNATIQNWPLIHIQLEEDNESQRQITLQIPS